jgi:hypothetical protein
MKFLVSRFSFHVSDATRRDWDSLCGAVRDWLEEMRQPRELLVLILAAAVVAAIVILPWLTPDDKHGREIRPQRAQRERN